MDEKEALSWADMPEVQSPREASHHTNASKGNTGEKTSAPSASSSMRNDLQRRQTPNSLSADGSVWINTDNRSAAERSLVLFDELGAGTDPTEGAALAIAILSNLHSRGVRTIATTHYSELKVYALSTPGVENGCCEFNVETLRPTYRLLIGVPGKSNAFAISEKLGLPDYIIEEAKEHLTQQDETFEDVITNLETSRAALEQEQEAVTRYKRELEELKASLSHKEERLDETRNEILRKAREEAREILRDAKDYADETIRTFNRLGKESDASRKMEQERTKLREKAAANDEKLGMKAGKKTKKELTAKDLRIGDGVRVLSLNLNGTVSTLPDAKGNLFVQMGILRSQVNIRDLELLEEEPLTTYGAAGRTGGAKGSGSQGRTGTGASAGRSGSSGNSSGASFSGRLGGSDSMKSADSSVRNEKSYYIRSELDLIGKTTDEAIAELDKYMDDACLAHLSPIRIVHGKGSGILRKAVHQYLRRQSYVASYRLGEFGEGDSGVTIVELK
ncbi:MAG: Smr/MutS family protein [Lachnospiraceae bacterium]|nr:Smr/MutS family protein [Lachnospiraceae bacterium]